MPPDNMNIEQLLQQMQQWKERAQKAEQEVEERAQKAEQEEERAQKTEQEEERAQKTEQEVEERAQKAEQEKERAQKAEQKAEKRFQKVKKWAERRVQEAEEKIRGLPWPEALFLWHTIHANPTIKFRQKTIAAGHFTKPTGCRYPTLLCRWPKFHDLHKKAFEEISYHFAKPESSVFYSRKYYESIAKDFMRGCKLDSEAALVAYKERTVEDLVVNTWWRMGEGQIRFKNREDHSLDHTKDRVS